MAKTVQLQRAGWGVQYGVKAERWLPKVGTRYEVVSVKKYREYRDGSFESASFVVKEMPADKCGACGKRPPRTRSSSMCRQCEQKFDRILRQS